MKYRTEYAALLGEYLPSVHKDLGSSNDFPVLHQPGRVYMPVIPALRRWGQEDQVNLAIQ